MQTPNAYRTAEDWRDAQDEPTLSRTETVKYPGGVPPVDPNELRADAADLEPVETVVIDDPDLAAASTVTSAEPYPELTPRERQIALLLAIGKKNSEIADELRVSIKTVDTHRGNLLNKLGLRNNVELCLLGCRMGWVIP